MRNLSILEATPTISEPEKSQDEKMWEWVRGAFRSLWKDVDNYNLKIVFSTRMNRCEGYAGYKRNRRTGEYEYTISMSQGIWNKTNDEERKDTAVHEACHILDHILNGSMSGHGNKWKRLMHLCGYPDAKRSHSVNLSGIDGRFDCRCTGCGHESTLGKIQVNKMKRYGVEYICRKCKTPYELI